MNDLKNLLIQNLYDFQEQNSVDAIVIPDGDFFLNEYTPADDSIRKQLTKFLGSVGQAFTIGNSLHLIVDGRYEISAKAQFVGDQLDIVSFTPQIAPKMLQLMQAQQVRRLGVWMERMSSSEFQSLAELFELVDVAPLFKSSFSPNAPETLYATRAVPLCLDEGEVLVTHQVDAIARLSGLRSDYFPYMSSLPGVLFYSNHEQVLATSFAVDQQNLSNEAPSFVQVASLLEVPDLAFAQAKTFIYDPAVTNQGLVAALVQKYGQERVQARAKLNSRYMTFKGEQELAEFKDSFAKADAAIWKTLNWARANAAEINEVQIKQKIIEQYRQSGAWRESFHPISGLGKNSAIIHYGSPSQSKQWEEGEFLLLDSGAYYHAGVATDTTRTLYRGRPDEKAVRMYTLVLRGLMKAQMSIFPAGTLGSQIDMLAREPLLQVGKNYAHGTGHGIGVHVHEAGYLLNPLSTVPLSEGQVGSIEPGYYEEGWGGIRLENAVVVKQHPEFKDMLCFEPLTMLPFEEELIDRSLFTAQELEYFDRYQSAALARL